MIESLQLSLTQNQVQIVKALLYFDVFNYPLTRRELFENLSIAIPVEVFEKELEDLLRNGTLKEEGKFIQDSAGSQNDISKRMKGNAGAAAIMPTAYRYSRKIASFPFVEGVCLSGALSKNYYDEKGDIDFFIITTPGRLWICRTLLILRYKLLPKRLKKFWCTNYFISSNDLSVPDVNAFTATELAHLVPVVNYNLYKNLLGQNSWYRETFPNKPVARDLQCIPRQKTWLSSLIERLLSGRPGDSLDDRLLNLTLAHWKKKYPEIPRSDFELQFRSRKNVCKRHTKGFQNKVLKTWDDKVMAFEHRFRVSLR